MRLLLDTHVLLWTLAEPGRLTKATVAAIVDPANDVFVSAASAWEISIKQALGKLELPGPALEWLPGQLSDAGLDMLDVTARHGLLAGALPPHHRDPFDRLFIAQAMSEGLTLVTRDGRLAAYGAALMPA